MSEETWNALRLQSLPLQALVTFAAIIVCATLVACLILICILLVRLGWDALFSPSPTYQEATKNFLLAFASAFGAPFLVWRTWVAHQQAKAASQQARVALENHITGIFSKSVELMGLIRETKTTDPNGAPAIKSTPNIEARLGALYSLERLLGESERDQRTILETLCAYVRENSPIEVPETGKQQSTTSPAKAFRSATSRADVQAALTIIGRRPESLRARAEKGQWQLDFRNTNLTTYDFSGLNYDRANLTSSFLNGANMSRSSFANCVLARTSLRDANLKEAYFCASHFNACDLTGATVESTNFRLANFVQTDLTKANVTSLAIEGADLENAFSPYHLQYALEEIRKGSDLGPHHLKEIFEIANLFQKATADKNTNLPQEVHDAMEFINSKRSPD